MYLPPHFEISDTGQQHDLIAAHPLGLLVSHGADGLLANPVPFVLDRDFAPLGRLQCHQARANEQWKNLAGIEVLVIFSGIDHYISPSYYRTKQENGKVVPTWNYIQVHAYGTVVVHDDADWIARQISALTHQHEDPRPQPWAVSDAPAPFIAAQIRAIVGLEIQITRLQGKWKLSQNRVEADQTGVHEGLELESSEAARMMAALIPVSKN